MHSEALLLVIVQLGVGGGAEVMSRVKEEQWVNFFALEEFFTCVSRVILLSFDDRDCDKGIR